jgi:hypothetical protein
MHGVRVQKNRTTVQSAVVGSYAIYVLAKDLHGEWGLLVHMMATGMVTVPHDVIRREAAETEGILRMEQAFALSLPLGLKRYTGIRLQEKAIIAAEELVADETFTKCGLAYHRNLLVEVPRPFTVPGPVRDFRTRMRKNGLLQAAETLDA